MLLGGYVFGSLDQISNHPVRHKLYAMALIVGAGGAGLRAAIEAASTGLKAGVVCKSLLGKAHTVMAEGRRRSLARQRGRPR